MRCLETGIVAGNPGSPFIPGAPLGGEIGLNCVLCWIMNSQCWRRTSSILLLAFLGTGFQTRLARSQSVGFGVWRTGEFMSVAPASLSSNSLFQPAQGERYQKALADFSAGNLKLAAQELRDLHSAAARNTLGLVLETLGDHAGALAAFQEALRLQPDSAKAAYNAAKLLIREGRLNAAILLLQSALKARQDSGDATPSLQMLLAKAYIANGENNKAAKTLEVLSTVKPDCAQIRFNLAAVYGSMGSLDAAVTQYREGLRLSPKDGEGLMGLAKTLVKLKKAPEAMPYIHTYIFLKPQDAEGYYVLAGALRDTGRTKEASGEFLQAAHLKPDDYDIRYHSGMALWRTGQLEAALSELEAAERLQPDKVQVHSALARVLRSLDKKEQAREEGMSAERLSVRKYQRDQASFFIAKGDSLLKTGDFNSAAEQFRQALKADPESARARSNLGLMLTRLHDPQDGKREIQKAIALDPRLALAYNALGVSDLEMGQVSEAQAAFQQAIRINPQYAEAKNNLGALDVRLGRDAEAAALFEEATEDSPNYAQPYLNWGLLLASQGNLNAAKRMFEKALQLSPNLAQAQKALQIVQQTH